MKIGEQRNPFRPKFVPRDEKGKKVKREYDDDTEGDDNN